MANILIAIVKHPLINTIKQDIPKETPSYNA